MPANQILALLAVVLGLGLCGCTSAAQVRTLAAITDAAAVATPPLVDARERDGQGCLAGTPTADGAQTCLERVGERWAPIWAALRLLAAADRSAIEGSITWARVAGVWCALRSALPGVALPEVPGVVCPKGESKP